eukprot:3798380-Pleurochrysis_carterae.AAC.1
MLVADLGGDSGGGGGSGGGSGGSGGGVSGVSGGGGGGRVGVDHSAASCGDNRNVSKSVVGIAGEADVSGVSTSERQRHLQHEHTGGDISMAAIAPASASTK